MTKLVCLSFTITDQSPMYKDTPGPRFSPHKSISKGDSSNTFQIEINSHTATHVDAPAHFMPGGKRIGEYSAKELTFEKVETISIPKQAGEWVERRDLEKNVKQMDAECLLIKTGFAKKIGQEEYRTHNPGIAPEAMEWARTNMRHLRIIGIDSISISNQADSTRGRAAHKAAFEAGEGRSDPLLIIEGMDLRPLGDGALRRLHLFPWFAGPTDSSPCTVIAEV